MLLLLTAGGAACGTARETAPESGTRAAGGSTTAGAHGAANSDGGSDDGIGDGLSEKIRATWCEANQRPWCTVFSRAETEGQRQAFMYLDIPYTPESGSLAVTACEDLYEIIGGEAHPWRRGSVLASGYLLAYRDERACRVVEEFYGIETAARYETSGLHGTIVVIESNETPFLDGKPEKFAEIEAETRCARLEEYLREGLLTANSPVFSPLTRRAGEAYAAFAKTRSQARNCPALLGSEKPTR
jgi:hypothetical protein